MKPMSLLSLYVLSTAYERPSYGPDVLLSAPPSSLHKPGHISRAPTLLHSQLPLHRHGQLHAVTQHWPSGRLWHWILRRCSQKQKTLSCYKAQKNTTKQQYHKCLRLYFFLIHAIQFSVIKPHVRTLRSTQNALQMPVLPHRSKGEYLSNSFSYLFIFCIIFVSLNVAGNFLKTNF